MQPTEANERVRVVIVDDHADIRALLKLQFEIDGRFEVTGEAGDGNEAIELAQRLQPDLLVLDRHMPGRGGIETIEPVRDVAPRTAIVLYTAALDAGTHRAALAAGALHVLEKVAGRDFVDQLTTTLFDGSDTPVPSVEVYVGPVPNDAARVWVTNTKAIIAAVRRHPEVVSAPDEMLDLFESLLDQWEEIARDGDEFRWLARASRDDLVRIVEHWAVIDAMTDEQLDMLGIQWSPPEGQPFFEALTTGVLRALQRSEETRRLGERLLVQWAPYRRSE